MKKFLACSMILTLLTSVGSVCFADGNDCETVKSYLLHSSTMTVAQYHLKDAELFFNIAKKNMKFVKDGKDFESYNFLSGCGGCFSYNVLDEAFRLEEHDLHCAFGKALALRNIDSAREFLSATEFYVNKYNTVLDGLRDFGSRFIDDNISFFGIVDEALCVYDECLSILESFDDEEEGDWEKCLQLSTQLTHLFEQAKQACVECASLEDLLDALDVVIQASIDFNEGVQDQDLNQTEDCYYALEESIECFKEVCRDVIYRDYQG